MSSQTGPGLHTPGRLANPKPAPNGGKPSKERPVGIFASTDQAARHV